MSEVEREPTEDEVRAERRRILDNGVKAAEQLLARAEARAPVSRWDLILLVQFIQSDFVEFVTRHVGKRAVLRDEPSIAERALTPIWRGVHEVGRLYGPNDLVTAKGSLWIALKATSETPGAGATSWRLAVKGR